MEVSHFQFPFLNQDEDYSNFFQAMDNNGENTTKRKRNYLHTSNSSESFNWQEGIDSIHHSFNNYENSSGFHPDFEENKRKQARREIPESSGGAVHPRRLWVKNRSNAWWEQCNSPDFPEEEFRRAFLMSKSTFDMICKLLDSTVTKKNTMLRLAIPVRQRVAVCIYRLATGEPLRLVSKRFGLGISTCHKLIIEVSSAIKTILMPKFLQWPNQSKLNEIKSKFQSISSIPNICGSIYTTHIPIIAPKNNVSSYFNKLQTERNQKTSYSITVQAIVDPTGVFTDVCIGWPGSNSNENILEKSTIFERGNNGEMKDLLVVGNSTFPLMDWLLLPYGHGNNNNNITWTQHTLNEKIGEVQEVAKAAFGRLKGRWGCLQKRTEVKLIDLPVLIGACCVLHNICEIRGEEMEKEIMGFEVFDDEMMPENPIRSSNSIKARDNIAHNLLHHNVV